MEERRDREKGQLKNKRRVNKLCKEDRKERRE
jgi:hypothetical protein